MSVIISKDPFSQLVDGFQLPGMFSPDNFRSAVNYKTRSDDIFVVTYPKCGTTWVQNILLLILQNGQPVRSMMEMLVRSPFLEMIGTKYVEDMVRPGPIKTHLPYLLTPWNNEAKYIYVARNPKDCCVSYFHHMKNVPGHNYTGSFDHFFELFISGNLDYGDYFDHLLSWYNQRNEPNILFVTYEELKENVDSAILKMASFIDDKRYAEPIRNDPEVLNMIKKYSSFDEMKVLVNKGFEEMFYISVEDLKKTGLPDIIIKFILELKKNPVPVDSSDNAPSINQFIQKGIVGDWRNYFSEDQCQRLEHKFSKLTKNTDISNFWKNYI